MNPNSTKVSGRRRIAAASGFWSLFARILTVFLAAPAIHPSLAGELSGYAVVTTDYVFRGVSYSDSHAAAQLGGDVAFDSGFYFGLWGSTVDISGGPGNQRDFEVDVYAGYGYELTNDWSVDAKIVSYNFPATEGQFDYDYIEYSLTGNYRDRLWFEYSYSPDLFHSGWSTHNYDLYTEWQVAGEFVAGAGIGFYDVSGLTGSDYRYWQLGVTHPLSVFDVDLRYFDTSDWVPIVSTPERAEQRVVLSLRYQF
ncbi:MAG: TorF family putative porin [Woeseiaceae bacterium]|nr:TorF family putative porin [Woeseiaceae bacterium]